MGSVLEGSTLTAVGSAAAAFVVSVATYSWRARGIQAELEKKIDASRDTLLNETRETITAIRTKVNLLELETERNFVRRADFQNAVDSFTRSIDQLRAEIQNGRSELKEEYAGLRDLLVQILQGKVGPTAPHR